MQIKHKFLFLAIYGLSLLSLSASQNATKAHSTPDYTPDLLCPTTLADWSIERERFRKTSTLESFLSNLDTYRQCSLREDQKKFFEHPCLKPIKEYSEYLWESNKETDENKDELKEIISKIPKEIIDKKFWNTLIESDKIGDRHWTKDSDKILSKLLEDPRYNKISLTKMDSQLFLSPEELLKRLSSTKELKSLKEGSSVVNVRIPLKNGELFLNSFLSEIPYNLVFAFYPNDPKEKPKYFRLNDTGLDQVKTKITDTSFLIGEYKLDHNRATTMYCASCHQAGWIPLRPDPAFKYKTIHGADVSGDLVETANAKYKNRRQDIRWARPPNFIPSFGPRDSEFRQKYLDLCLGKNVKPEIRANVIKAMSCVDCHKGNKNPKLFPIASWESEGETGEEKLTHSILTGAMPPDDLQEKTDDEIESRKLLHRCLDFEYFGQMSHYAEDIDMPWEGLLMKALLKNECK